MPTVDEILEAARNPAFIRAGTARILLRQDLLERFEDLDRRLDAAVKADMASGGDLDSKAPALAAELDALRDEVESAKVEFRFRAIGKRAWFDLLAAHPPTAKDLEQYGRNLDHNPRTFPAAAVAATLVDPAMTVEQVTELESVLNASQFDTLFNKAVDVNIGGIRDPKSLAAGLIRRRNGQSANSVTPAAEASLDQFSSDEPASLEAD